MLTTRSNYHHSKLPPVGAIVHVLIADSPYTRVDNRAKGNPWGYRWRKFRVVSYPLCDSPQWRGRYMSLGIHTVNLQALDNRQQVRVSGHWCETL